MRLLTRVPFSLRLGALYLLLSGAWIVLTDSFLSEFQTLKGLAFVAITTVLIVGLVHRAMVRQRQAYDRLKESETRFRALVERAWDIITVVEPDGTRRYHSPAAARIFGLPLDELMDRGLFDLIHPEDRSDAEQAFRDLLERPGATDTMELRAVRPDDSIRHLEVTARNLVGDPAVGGIVLNSRDITEQKQAELGLRMQVERLSALNAIDRAILASRDLSASLDVVLEQVINRLGVDAAAVLLLDDDRRELTHAASRGFTTPAIVNSRVGLGEGYTGRILDKGGLTVVAPIAARRDGFTRQELAAAEGFVSYVGVPLVALGEQQGVLELYSRSLIDPDEDWLSFTRALGFQAAIAVDSVRLFQDLQAKNRELELAYDRTLEGWARALELRDDETQGHSLRVVDLSLKLADALRVPLGELVHIRRGALLHDVGKIGVPDSILLKPGRLTDEEWEIMRRHPDYARQILEPIPFLRPAIDIPYSHHERWDGAGYPLGLSDEEIPLAARIFAVVDVFDALTSDRPYRPAWTREEATMHILDQAGSHFDPVVVEAFLTCVVNSSTATWRRLP